MKIVGIKGYHLSVPLKNHGEIESVSVSNEEIISSTAVTTYKQTHKDTIFVVVMTDTGITGYGECPTQHGTRGLLKLAGENILGADIEQVTNIMDTQMLGRVNANQSPTVHQNLPMIPELNALEFAFWDAQAKSAKVPVANLLGGRVRKKVALANCIENLRVEECITEIDCSIKKGIRSFKLKIGGNSRRDLDLLKEIRDTFGWEIILRLDAENTWEDPCDAARFLSQAEKYDIQYVQDAFKRADGYSYKRLRSITGIPVAIGKNFNELNLTPKEARCRLMELIHDNCIDVLAVNPSATGGLLGFTRIAAICEGAAVNIVADNACGSLSQAIWATGCIVSNSASYAHDILTCCHSGADLARSSLVVNQGYVELSEAAGFGITPNWESIKRFCIGVEQVGNL